jgi:hypothetical protein
MIPLRSHTAGAMLTDGFQLEEPERGRWGVALLVAIAAHTLGALYAGALPPPQAPPLPPVEVELAFREPSPPPPEPVVETPEPEAKPADVKPIVKPKAAEPPAPPAAAKAGAVLTAAPDAQEPDPTAEPFDFTSDPNSTVYGAGVVAVGGTATVGASGAQVGGRGSLPVTSAPAGVGLTAASDLSERPRLRDSDPCRGYFPKNAASDAAVATVRVIISKGGKVTSASIVSEAPSGQGFGSAARTCMLAQVFTPARDREGQPAATLLNVNVKFTR